MESKNSSSSGDHGVNRGCGVKGVLGTVAMFSIDCVKLRRRLRGELMSGLEPPYRDDDIRLDIDRLSANASALIKKQKEFFMDGLSGEHLTM